MDKNNTGNLTVQVGVRDASVQLNHHQLKLVGSRQALRTKVREYARPASTPLALSIFTA